MIKRYQNHKISVWYDGALIVDPTLPLFDVHYWKSSGKVIGSAQGRGTTWFVQLNQLQGALRHYRRGGLFGKLISDRYCFTSWEQTRCALELKLLQHLRQANVQVPRPIAAKAERIGLVYTADILVERIPNSSDLVARLLKNPLTKAVYQRIGAEIAKMHQAGVNHTDLNIHNLLLDREDRVFIIDFDKCRFGLTEKIKQENLKRLKRSFIKEHGKVGIHWTADDFNLLMEGYEQQLNQEI